MSRNTAASEQWDESHRPPSTASTNGTSSSIPARLYTDENPATTIKGTGFKNRAIAQRTIRLTAQPGVRYKQYWTIRAMRERAHHHPHQTDGMRDAIAVFNEWLDSYTEPTAMERREQEAEWQQFRQLCGSEANKHSYGRSPSEQEMKRARDDLLDGQKLLFELLSRRRPNAQQQSPSLTFSLTSFTALFGGPGLHGYGKHSLALESATSQVDINGMEGMSELIGDAKVSKLGLVDPVHICMRYERDKETATVKVDHPRSASTVMNLWNRAAAKSDVCKSTSIASDNDGEEKKGSDDSEPSWTCTACTLIHIGKAKHSFLACELCGSERTCKSVAASSSTGRCSKTSAPLNSMRIQKESPKSKPQQSWSLSSPPSWGSLRAPSQKDIHGKRKRQKGLDSPPPMFDYLIVLDFEWTADNTRKMEPVAEITQFPSVALKLSEGTKDGRPDLHEEHATSCNIPDDLRPLPLAVSRRDAWCVSVFDSFVKPTLNPMLTRFSIDLTGISQDMVNSAPTIDQVIIKYVEWLRSLGLVDKQGNRIGTNWSFATWGDVDLMSTLRLELQHKSIDMPSCFDRWINLKDDAIFKKHYHREPRGGLRTCVDSVGAHWEGRAHNGLVDSINTAKIVRHMVQTGFRFTRSTRGLDKDGVPFGQRNRERKESKK